jgi:hypothetical protein
MTEELRAKVLASRYVAEQEKRLELVPEAEEPEFDQQQIRDLLLELDGDVTATAKALGVDPERLRTYVFAMPALKRAIDETLARGVDEAIAVLFAALRDQGSFQNRYYAAKEFLRSDAGRRRGFGPREKAALEIKPNSPSTITLKWLEPPAD